VLGVRASWVLLSVSAGAAAADPIVDRDYAIELYEGVAIGDSSQTGMGGAGAAHIVGSAGTLLNASAPAVRRTTDNDGWSWDYHLDARTGRYSSDYDNNGISAAEDSGALLFTGGLALRFGDWSGAFTVTRQTAPVDGSLNPTLEAEAERVKFVIARYFQGADLAIGVGAQGVAFQLGPTDDNAPRLFSITGGGAIAGATWLPRGESWRVGLSLESKIVGGTVEADNCDPMDCMGYILPNTIESPARTILGFAYRWAPTAWNQLVKTKFRDEHSVTFVSDLVVTGTSPNGNGIEGFAMRELQPSGRSVTVSLRGGAEVEAMPGRLRVRAGSYWEPARFDGVGGRVHGTFGLELRALEFYLIGLRRGRLGLTADIASRYRSVGLSIGFWH
jgi:hypothetical protein